MRGKGRCIQSNNDFHSVLQVKLSALSTKYDNCLHKPFSSDISTPAWDGGCENQDPDLEAGYWSISWCQIYSPPQWSSICWALNWPCVLWILHTSAAAFSTTDSKCKWPWSFPCLPWWHAYHLWLVNPPKNNFTQITCKRNGINFNDVSQFGFKPGSLKKNWSRWTSPNSHIQSRKWEAVEELKSKKTKIDWRGTAECHRFPKYRQELGSNTDSTDLLAQRQLSGSGRQQALNGDGLQSNVFFAGKY